MGNTRKTLSRFNSFPLTNERNWAPSTVVAPTHGPRKNPAMGPKNWNTVKYWFGAPTKAEKLIWLATKAPITNKTKKIPRTTFLCMMRPNRFLKTIKAHPKKPLISNPLNFIPWPSAPTE